MAQGKNKTRLSRIGIKIGLLSILGFLGILIIQGTQFYVNRSIKDGLALEREARKMIQMTSELLFKETEFINQLRGDLLPGITAVNDGLANVLSSALSHQNSPAINQKIDEARKVLEDHSQLFDKTKDSSIRIKDLRHVLTDHFRVSDDDLKFIIQAITDEETNMIMSGEELTGNKIALRDNLKEYLGFSSAAMLNVVDLLAFADVDKFQRENENLKNSLDLVTKNIEGMVMSVEEQEIKAKWNQIKKEQEFVFKTINDTFLEWGHRQDFLAQLNQNVTMLQEKFKGIENQAGVELAAAEKKGLWAGRITVAVILVMLVVVSLLVIRMITRPVKAMTTILGKMADGDFSQVFQYKSRDEIGQMAVALSRMGQSQVDKANLAAVIADGDLTAEVHIMSANDSLGLALEKMVSGLNEVIGQINQAVTQIASGSNQVSDSSQSLSQGATQQAASLEEITSSMTEMASQTKNNAENASQANQLSINARQSAEIGNNQMQEMISAMEEISRSSKEIAKIIKTIDDIAFQTNLLALNAAVEAARAGKHGKGFAVVAQEVRNLASRSAKAAQETSDLIEGEVKKVGAGREILDKTAKALEEIVQGSTKVADLVAEISTASNEQAQGITQINQGLGQVEQVTQQNTASAEQTAAAAEELSSQASRLRQLVARFIIREQESAPLDQARLKKDAAPLKLNRPQFTGWEDENLLKDQAETVIRPQDIIALDDGDFGKY